MRRRTRSDASRASNTNRTKCVCRSVGITHTHGQTHTRTHTRIRRSAHTRTDGLARAQTMLLPALTQAWVGRDGTTLDTERWKRFAPHANTQPTRRVRGGGGMRETRAHRIPVAAAVCINNVKNKEKKKRTKPENCAFSCARAHPASAFTRVCVCTCARVCLFSLGQADHRSNSCCWNI